MSFKIGDIIVFKDSPENRRNCKENIGVIVKIFKIKPATSDIRADHLFEVVKIKTNIKYGYGFYDYRFERIKPTLNKQIQVL